MATGESQILPLKVSQAGGETEQIELVFGREGLVPAVIQEDGTNEVLLVAFMNREAFELTRQSGLAHFWSRSRQKLWLKGETSGDYLLVQSIFVNCEDNSVLVKVKLAGKAACHTGNKSCYYREVQDVTNKDSL
ncbi:MAG TPA: phosphoribosyl-AMP cyclohydrolase [Chloroflexia bacterium]|nr:phosphoribosyl-AMP cyclohydrolase [Chloroflexia bacterium]